MDSQNGELCGENLDPRIRRTRLLLQQALGKLLETKEFDKISVQDIAEAATVNRATFYDHYTDKFALLECMVGTRFGELLAARGVRFDGGCSSALRAMIQGVCDYLVDRPGSGVHAPTSRTWKPLSSPSSAACCSRDSNCTHPPQAFRPRCWRRR